MRYRVVYGRRQHVAHIRRHGLTVIPVSGVRHRMADVVDDGEHGADGVQAQREPPDELLVEFLFEVFEHQQADGEAGQRTGYVGHVADGRRGRGRFERVPAVHRETDVHAGCEPNGRQKHLININILMMTTVPPVATTRPVKCIYNTFINIYKRRRYC